MSLRLWIIIGVSFLILGLVGTVSHYRVQMLAGEVEITRLNGEVEKLATANAGLEKEALKVKAEVEGYIRAVNKMGEVNTELNAKLQSGRAKLAQHKLLAMRSSRHSELLLKTINKSVARQQKEWMQ